MKYLPFLAAGLLWGAAVFAESSAKTQPFFSWNLLWSGSWEEISSEKDGTIHSREEIKLNFHRPGLVLRGESLNRHTMNFELDPPWSVPEKKVANLLGGLYHKPTGSRLLYGVLDEWGLSARIRNPWIRSAPYAENHKPMMADLKTAASVTKEDEAYLYLSSPVINPFSTVKIRGFASALTKIDDLQNRSSTPDFSAGLDTSFTKNVNLLLEGFYTGAALPPTKNRSWFSTPPPLPEREFDLYALGVLFNTPLLSVSSDWAYSQTFAWGADMYANLGVRLSPALSFGSKPRPLAISFAVDGAGERFVYRDGLNHGAGFRTAGKIEWKGKQNSLFRLNTMVRGPGIEEEFNRSSSGIYYRFPARRTGKNSGGFPVRLTRISFSTDRNAVNPLRIYDGFSGNLGLSITLPKAAAMPATAKTSPLGLNLAASVKGLNSSDTQPPPYPVSWDTWEFTSASRSCEFSWSPQTKSSGNLQLKAKAAHTTFVQKDDVWDISMSASLRLKQGRLGLKAMTSDFPDKWRWTVSWRLEKK